MKRFFAKNGHHPDSLLLVLVASLSLAGLAILASASSDIGSIKFGDSYYYLKHQLLYGLLFGILGFVAGYFIPYYRYKKISLIMFFVTLGFLLLVFTPLGITSGGATRWINIGPISFQPSEFLKLTFIIYLAAWFANLKANRSGGLWSGLIPFMAVCGVVSAMLIFQPATSVVVILMLTALIMYFMSGAPFRYVAAVVFLGVLGIGILIAATPYRMERIMGYLNPQSDTQGINYQGDQARIAIGSGRLFGMGYGQATAKTGYLPAVIDDSIFAVVGQELGFAGAGAAIVLFAMLSLRFFSLARRAPDRFASLVLVGFGSVIAIQSLVHIGSISGIFPLTGVPLPFVSYGGTALAVFLTMSGIAVNISKHT